jgi:hypothetical protein
MAAVGLQTEDARPFRSGELAAGARNAAAATTTTTPVRASSDRWPMHGQIAVRRPKLHNVPYLHLRLAIDTDT